MLRIAHAHGNRRARIAKALAAGVDLIEADIRYARGRLWVRHEHKAPFVPLLFNGRISRFHRQGPYALSLPRGFLRINVAPIAFDELLDLVGDRSGLLLDLKAGVYSRASRVRFIALLLRMLDSWYHGPIRFCGDWRSLDEVRKQRPDHSVHYSVDDDGDWKLMLARIDTEEGVPAITLRQRMVSAERAAYLVEQSIEFYVWDIETRAEAQEAIRLGASGLISHHLDSFPPKTASLEAEAS